MKISLHSTGRYVNIIFIFIFCFVLFKFDDRPEVVRTPSSTWEGQELMTSGSWPRDLIKIPKDQLIPNKSSTMGHHIKYHTIYAKRNYYKYTFFPTVIPLWNSLPVSAVSEATIDIFKDKLAAVTLKKPY